MKEKIQFKLENGYVLPCIGYGTYPQKESLVENIPLTVKSGYRLIDVSDNYYNEEFVGQGMMNLGDEHDIHVVTKFSQPSRTYELENCFRESNSKLANKINIYLLHWPYPFLWKIQWRAMEKLYKDGRCDAIGVCNFEKKHLKKMLSFCKVKPMIDQIEHHPFFQQKETIDFCQDNGIQVMAYSPLARMDKTVIENSILSKIATAHHKSVEQVIFRWNVQHRCIPIPGSKSEKHIRDNIDIFDFKLTDEEMKQIDALESGMRVRFDPDKRFTLKEKFCFLIKRIKCIRKDM